MESIEQFLESQRALLDKTLADISKLQALKERALADPESFVDNLQSEVSMLFFSSIHLISMLRTYVEFWN